MCRAVQIRADAFRAVDRDSRISYEVNVARITQGIYLLRDITFVKHTTNIFFQTLSNKCLAPENKCRTIRTFST